MRQASLVVLALVLSPGAARGQVELPAFEVVSVKPLAGEPVFGGPDSPDRFVREADTLLDLVRYAYDLPAFRVSGGPQWLRSQRFTVSAKAATVPEPDHVRFMVRRLLQDRFGLQAHTEMREMNRYALVLARRDGRLGDQLRRSTLDCPAILAAREAGGPPASADPPASPPRCTTRVRVAAGNLTIMLEGAPLEQLVEALQRQVGRPIVDRTGLSGTFDVELEFTPERPLAVNGAPVPAPPTGSEIALFTALREQLGLALDAERGPVEVLVIDEARLPDPD